MKKDVSVTKVIAIGLFVVIASVMFGFSAFAVLRFDSYHTRVLFYFNDVNQREEGLVLPQKRQQSSEEELRLYLLALLSRPANADMRPIFNGESAVSAIYLLEDQSVIVLIGETNTMFGSGFSMDKALVENGLNFNFPQLKPFTILFEKGDAT